MWLCADLLLSAWWRLLFWRIQSFDFKELAAQWRVFSSAQHKGAQPLIGGPSFEANTLANWR